MQVEAINKCPVSVLQKKRVCAYARVSTDSRRQEDSLENQTATNERLIKGNLKYEFAGVYADQGISGYCENRPQFQKMLERARAGEFCISSDSESCTGVRLQRTVSAVWNLYGGEDDQICHGNL